mmetsp:Transcript_62065/g.165947  ORF Transcript_62065/g.165947 Transcript_62065/m.165947 type:complete len:222 (-) Transcript_62065:54-719(-)
MDGGLGGGEGRAAHGGRPGGEAEKIHNLRVQCQVERDERLAEEHLLRGAGGHPEGVDELEDTREERGNPQTILPQDRRQATATRRRSGDVPFLRERAGERAEARRGVHTGRERPRGPGRPGPPQVRVHRRPARHRLRARRPWAQAARPREGGHVADPGAQQATSCRRQRPRPQGACATFGRPRGGRRPCRAPCRLELNNGACGCTTVVDCVQLFCAGRRPP